MAREISITSDKENKTIATSALALLLNYGVGLFNVQFFCCSSANVGLRNQGGVKDCFQPTSSPSGIGEVNSKTNESILHTAQPKSKYD